MAGVGLGGGARHLRSSGFWTLGGALADPDLSSDRPIGVVGAHGGSEGGVGEVEGSREGTAVGGVERGRGSGGGGGGGRRRGRLPAPDHLQAYVGRWGAALSSAPGGQGAREERMEDDDSGAAGERGGGRTTALGRHSSPIRGSGRVVRGALNTTGVGRQAAFARIVSGAAARAASLLASPSSSSSSDDDKDDVDVISLDSSSSGVGAFHMVRAGMKGSSPLDLIPVQVIPRRPSLLGARRMRRTRRRWWHWGWRRGPA